MKQQLNFKLLFSIANGMLLVMAATAYIVAHGGLAGDFRGISQSDAVGDRADFGSVVMNRWTLSPNHEPLITRAYFYVNLPSYAASRVAFEIASLFWPELRKTFPLGISHSTFIVLPGTMLTFVQWYLIGLISNRFALRH